MVSIVCRPSSCMNDLGLMVMEVTEDQGIVHNLACVRSRTGTATDLPGLAAIRASSCARKFLRDGSSVHQDRQVSSIATSRSTVKRRQLSGEVRDRNENGIP